MLAQQLATEARLALQEVTLFKWSSARKIHHAQVEMLEIINSFIVVFSLVCLVPVDQL